ncbi:transporter [Nostoc sp. CENA67]|uniref:Transporter n=1 Tax=Amazonocrinis nigriterrae CENA67 TaxID=2794033 RepID=A0A8J7HV61_9NOST|nr:transporter [Amazonocrinis nigriterrae]MBH8566412.1 transporter [Amazonocrinis nigriterrae CENA67]
MKKLTQHAIAVFGATALATLFAPNAQAVDHNNIDANRPLSFDDAESIGYREQAIELGGVISLPRDRSLGGEFEIEYLYGFAPNTHLNIGIDPSVGGRADSNDTRFDPGNISVGVFHNFNREYNNTPAFAVRADAYFPTGRDSKGVDFRLRGIASKTVGQYDRLHLNLDLNVNTSPDSDESSVIPGIILGYSKPLGYPRRFDRTFVAEVGVRDSEEKGEGAIVSAGVGLRQQVGYQSVLDLGLKGDIAGSDGDGERSQLRLVAGYSVAF